jgi:2,4-dienoyl-CoA reductase-like NADH-dependent reductase (Old Yellow Enzyme family)
MNGPKLFEPLQLRGVTISNRIMLAPMNQHSAIEGYAGDFALVHLGKFALGGFGLIMTEATAIERDARIAPGDLGIWSDDHIPGLRRICDFLHEIGSVTGIQLNHCGRKGSSQRPWQGFGALSETDIARGEKPWPLVGPTAEALGPGHVVPSELTHLQILEIIESFARATKRADAADFDVVEIHGGHGYLIANFLTPQINKRTDAYGGDRAGRMRFGLEVAEAVRASWPQDKPLFFRISSVDGHPEGWKIEDSVVFTRELKARGVDVIDCSSGGLRQATAVENTLRLPGYQVEYSAQLRRESEIATAAVGLILSSSQAEEILQRGDADLIALGRQALYDPYWAHHAAQELNADPNFEKWHQAAGWWLQKRTKGLLQAGYSSAGQPLVSDHSASSSSTE